MTEFSDQRVLIAIRYIEAGHTRPAIEALRELLSEKPDDADLHALMGMALSNMHRLEAAKHEAGLALAINPHSTLALRTLGRVFTLQNKPTEALAALDDALAIDPNDDSALLQKAQVHDFKREPAKQLELIQRALQIDASSADALLALGDYHLDHGDLDLASEIAERVLSDDAENAGAHVLRGRAQLRLGNDDGALEHARFAISMDPADRAALALLSDVKARKNWFLGLWWKLNTMAAGQPLAKLAAILVGAFLGFQLAAQLLYDFGYPPTAQVVSVLWLAIVLYSWIGLPIYQKMLNKELESFRFNPDY